MGSGNRHDDAQDIADAVIFHPKRIENDTASIQRHRHGQQRPAVREQGILGYALGVDLG